jgi:hypothetical protein
MPSKYFDQILQRRKPETKELVRQYLDAIEAFHQVATTWEKDPVKARQLFNDSILLLRDYLKKKQQK